MEKLMTPEYVASIRPVNFSDSEWACRDRQRKLTSLPYCNGGVGHGIDTGLKQGLQILRNELWERGINRGIVITSGYRCRAYNEYIKGATNSQHLYGKAADISVVNMSSERLMKIVEELGIFTGRGLYPKQGFIHVDTRNGVLGTPTRWAQIGGRYISLQSFDKYLY